MRHSIVTSATRALAALAIALSIGCAEERSGLSAAAWLSPPLDLSMLTLTFRQGSQVWYAHGAQFAADETLGMPHTSEWGTATGGSVNVAFELVDSAGTVAAAGEVMLELRPDWRWRVDFMNRAEDPGKACFGCSGSRAFPIAPSYRSPGHDSLWVTWGGNSIAHPAIY